MNRMLNYLMREPDRAPQDASPTDQQLLQRYLDSRDEASFGELVRRHEQSVLKACRQVLRSAVDVDDAFQATFLVLLRRARQVRWQPSLKSWLVAVAHRIAVRLAVSQQRTQRREKNIVPAPSANTPLADVSWQEACSVLHEELNKLPDSFRLPLLLCYLQGYSRDEAAELLGWKLGSVKAGLERGRNLLRQRLERRGVTLSAGLLTLLARPMTSEAVTAAARSVQAITGTVSARVLSLSRDVGLVGWSLGTRGALCLLVLLLGTASGVTLVWAKAPAEQASTPAIPTSIAPIISVAPDQPDAITVTGSVLDPAGQPAVGASIMVVKPPKRTTSRTLWPKPEPGTTTDSQGRFQLTVKYPQFHLVAQKPGFGLDFTLVTAEKAKQPLKLQLGEEMPIQGVAADESQKPVVGATLGVLSIRRYQPDVLEDALEQVRLTGNDNAPFRDDIEYLLIDFASLLSTRSDAQGHFNLRGLPVGAFAQLVCDKPGLAIRVVNVILLKGYAEEGTSRHRLTADIVDNAYLKSVAQQSRETIDQTRERLRKAGYGRQYEGSSLSINMRQGVSLEGTVRNLKGEPVPGVTVFTYRTVRGDAVTDQQGHYRLDDVSPAEDYSVQTQPHDRYLAAQGSAVHRDTGPIPIDIQVRQGAILRGQVIDSKTGKGVRSYIQVKPTPGNPLLNKPNLLNEHSTTSEPDGTFRLIAPSGDILVTASPSSEEKADGPMPYVLAKILPSHHGLLQQRGGDRESVHFQGQNQPVNLGYAYQLLELPTEGETSVELTMSRGKERTLHLVDPQGKPIESATIAGLDQTMQPLTVKGGTQQIVGLNSTEKTRNLFILDRTRKLGALVSASTVDTDPLTIKLEPLASFSGRIVNRENKPRVAMPLAIKPVLSTDRPGPTGVATQSWHPQTLQLFFPTVYTNQDGRFTLTDILPNIDFNFYSAQQNGVLLQHGYFMKVHRLKPGENHVENDVMLRENLTRPGNGR